MRTALLIRSVLCFGCLTLVAGGLSAGQNTYIAYEVPAGTEGNQEFAGALGHDFDVNGEILITRLGVFDSGADGLGLPITARIFDRATETELASIEFTPEEPGDRVGGSRFKELGEPLSLPAGFRGTIGASGYGESEPAGNQGAGIIPDLSTNDGPCSISFVGGGRFGDPNTPDAFPATRDVGPVNRYAAGTFEFAAVEVVEPSGGVAYSVPAGTAGNQAFTGSLGLDFDVDRTIEITSLGVFDSDSDGLGTTISARVYSRNSRIELARLDFSPDDPGELVDGSRFKALDPPLLLPAGTSATMVAFGYGSTELSGNQRVGSLPLGLDSGGCSLRFVGSRFGEASVPEAFPGNTNPGVPDLYVAGTFEFEPSDRVGEPPFRPRNPIATARDAALDVSWTPPAEGPPVESYNVYLLVADTAIRVNPLPVTSTVFRVGRLLNGVESCLVVRSVGLGGIESADSEDACGRPTSGILPETTFVAYEVPEGTIGNQSFGGSLGMSFTVNSDVIITRLGVFDGGSDGLGAPIFASIFSRRTGFELVTLSFTPGDPGTLVGGSRLKDLAAPLELSPGFEGIIVASGYGEAEMNGSQNAGLLDLSTNSGDCAISFGAASFGAASVDGLPSFPVNFDANIIPHHYAAGTFEYGLRPGAEVPGAREGTAYLVPEGTEGNQAFSGALGMDFIVNEAIKVTELGVFDDLSDGLRRPITARLFDRETRHALAVLEFTPDEPGELVGGSRFKVLTPPLSLPAGFHGAIVAEGYGEDERSGNQRVGDFELATDHGGCLLTFVGGGRFEDTIPGAFPRTPAGGPADVYAAGTFRFATDIILQLAGDCDQSGALGFGDISCMIEILFPGFVLVPRGVRSPCDSDGGNVAVLDLNGDAVLDLADVTYLSAYLLSGGPPPIQGTECFVVSSRETCPTSPGCQ